MLEKYFQKKVVVEFSDGDIVRGIVGDYIGASDNENGKESIIVNDVIRQFPVEIYEGEFKSIEIVEK